jgi:VanZ family protein
MDNKIIQMVRRWLPALSVMLLIFLFSAQPSAELPNFNWADKIVKKGGHMLGYAMLALSYWRALDFRKRNLWWAWAVTLLYALTDEFHQSFVPGRHPSIWDVLIFDNLGALFSLWILNLYKAQRPDHIRPIVEQVNAKGSR